MSAPDQAHEEPEIRAVFRRRGDSWVRVSPPGRYLITVFPSRFAAGWTYSLRRKGIVRYSARTYATRYDAQDAALDEEEAG